MNERFSASLVLVLVLTSLGLGGLFYAATEPDDPLTATLAVPPAVDQTLLATAGHRDQADKGLSAPSPQSLRSGRWGQFERGQLRPDSDLRGRFDLLLAERTGQAWPDMRKVVQAQATQELGSEGAQAVVRIWDNYLNLLMWDEALQNQADPQADTPDRWIASRQDFFRQARATLGSDWADAFFAEEEAQVRQLARSQQEWRVQSGMRDRVRP